MSRETQQHSSPLERYVSAEDVARFICASPKTVLRFAREGKIPAHCFSEGTVRRRWRFLLSEVDTWMRAKSNGAAG